MSTKKAKIMKYKELITRTESEINKELLDFYKSKSTYSCITDLNKDTRKINLYYEGKNYIGEIDEYNNPYGEWDTYFFKECYLDDVEIFGECNRSKFINDCEIEIEYQDQLIEQKFEFFAKESFSDEVEVIAQKDDLNNISTELININTLTFSHKIRFKFIIANTCR